jgi:hypothetical protein
LPEPIRDLLRGTPFADKSWELQELARIRDPEVQADVVRLLVEQGFETVEQARRALERRYEPCEACGVVLNGNAVKVRGVWHCQGCGDHPSEDEPVCGRCGARRDESPLPVQQEAVGALDDRAREATDPLAEETRRRREQAARDQATRDAFYDAAERLRWQDPVEVVRAVRRLNDDEGMDRVRLEAGKGLEWFARLDVEAWGGRAH